MSDRPNIEVEAKIILATIQEARLYSQPYDASQLFFIAEDLSAKLALFIDPLFDAETRYRQKVQEYIVEGMSVAGAEAKAKAGPEYQLYRKLTYVYNLADEQIKLIKKFADKLYDERRRG